MLIISGTRDSPRSESSAPILQRNTGFFLGSSNLYRVKKVQRKVEGACITGKPTLNTLCPRLLPACSSTTKRPRRRTLLEKQEQLEQRAYLTWHQINLDRLHAKQPSPCFANKISPVFKGRCSPNFKGIKG